MHMHELIYLAAKLLLISVWENRVGCGLWGGMVGAKHWGHESS